MTQLQEWAVSSYHQTIEISSRRLLKFHVWIQTVPVGRYTIYKYSHICISCVFPLCVFKSGETHATSKNNFLFKGIVISMCK